MPEAIDLGLAIRPDHDPGLSTFLTAERVLRLHPHWHVLDCQVQGNTVSADLKDHATDREFSLSFSLAFPKPGEVLLQMVSGPIRQIHFFPKEGRLHVAVQDSGQPLSAEEEQDLTLWLQSIRQYMRLYLTRSLYTLFFRTLMNKVILTMNPSQRKICLMLYRFTVLEVVVILIIIIGYFTLGR